MADLSILSERALRAEYALQQQSYSLPEWLRKVALLLSGEDRVKLPWLGGITTGMKERTGSGQVEKPNAQYIDLDVVEYEDGIEIPYKDMRRDKLGMLSRGVLLGALARGEMLQWTKLVLAAIVAGSAVEGYDGQYIFDTDHADADGYYTTAQSNLVDQDISAMPVVKSGSVTVPSVEDLVWAAGKGIETMMAFKDNAGEYVNEDIGSVCVFLSSSMWLQAAAMSKNNLTGYGASNDLLSFQSASGVNIEFVASPRLSAFTDDMVIVRTDGPRPFVIGLEEDLEPDIETKIATPANSDYCRKEECVQYEIRRNRIIKLGDWRLSLKVTLV
jgi:hypothetical protein